MRTVFMMVMCTLLAPLSAQETVTNLETTSLTITIKNIKKIKGHLLIAVFDHESKFLKDFSLAKRKKVTTPSDTIIFNNLPYGRYAVSIFQDENNNNALDSNFIGIPKEPYGFSNNPSTLFGPPGFKKAAFTIDTPRSEITIEL